MNKTGPLSYLVKVGELTWRRHIDQLRSSEVQVPLETASPVATYQPETQPFDSQNRPSGVPQPSAPNIPNIPISEPMQSVDQSPTLATGHASPVNERPVRSTRKPVWQQDYVMGGSKPS